MKNITIVYLPRETNEIKSVHVEYATRESLQETLDNNDVYMIEHILEQTRTIAINEFKVYASQDELVEFINKWDLDY